MNQYQLSQFLNDPTELWEQCQQYAQEDHSGYISGIRPVDEIIRLDDGSLTVLVGRPGEGKTTFLNYWLYRLSTENNLPLLYLSFETKVAKHMNQLLTYYKNRTELQRYCFFRNEKFKNTAENIEKTIRANVEHNGVKIVVVDPFNQIMRSGGAQDQDHIASVLNMLRDLSTELNISIILCHHVTKAAQKVDVQNASGSLMFNSICDNAISIEADHKKRTTKVSTQKIRNNGESGQAYESVTLDFDPYLKVFTYGEVPSKKADKAKKEPEEGKETIKVCRNRLNATAVMDSLFQENTPKFPVECIA